MLSRILISSSFSLVLAASAFAQAGGPTSSDTTPLAGTNAGGPVGTQGVARPNQPVPNDVGRRGMDCQKMSGVDAQRPATSGQTDAPQPQTKCD